MASYRELYIRSFKGYISTVAASVQGTAGVGIANLDVVIPQNYMMRILRCSVYSNSAGTPTFELFADNSSGSWRGANWTPDRTRRQHYTVNGKNDPGDFNQPPMFDEGEIPLLYWSGGSNGDICQACCLIAYYEKQPSLTHRTMLGLRHQESNEDALRTTTPAVEGSQWNLGNIETPNDLVSNGYLPWVTSYNPSEQPAIFTPLGPNQGQYVGGNLLGAQHPDPPFSGRVLPDRTRDVKDKPE